MTNINVENKGPSGAQIGESLTPAAVTGFTRGIAVTYGTDAFHAALPTAAGQQCVGIIDEDAIATTNPIRVIEFGQTVAQIGATVAALQSLACNASGQLVPAQPGQFVVAIALDGNPNAGDYVNVFVVAIEAQQVKGDTVVYYTASGAIAVANGTAVLNGAGALAMTLAAPTAAQDGTTIYIVAETAHAHTVTLPANGLYGTKHIITFAAEGDNVTLRAVALTWMPVGAVGGPTPAVIS
jgi:hypothetical protein